MLTQKCEGQNVTLGQRHGAEVKFDLEGSIYLFLLETDEIAQVDCTIPEVQPDLVARI